MPSLRSPLRPTLAPIAVVVAFLAVLVSGCRDVLTDLPPSSEEIGVVVNSVDVSLSLFDPREPEQVRTVGLAPDGSPVGVSVRRELAAVPLGIVPAVAVVDLRAGEVVRTVALPENSGATGSAFVNDSIVLVGNSNRNTVTPVNVLRGTTGEEIAVGTFPQEVVAGGGRVFVINAELGPDFQPAGPGTVTVLDAQTLEVVETVVLSGENPGAGLLSDGVLYVLNSGRFGEEGGTLSVVDPVSLTEVAHHTGFGASPGDLAITPGGLLHVASFAYGIAVWRPGPGIFIRSPANAVEPNGIPASHGVAVDIFGNLYSLEPECSAPGSVFGLSQTFDVALRIEVGTCPISLAFTLIPPE